MQLNELRRIYVLSVVCLSIQIVHRVRQWLRREKNEPEYENLFVEIHAANDVDNHKPAPIHTYDNFA